MANYPSINIQNNIFQELQIETDIPVDINNLDWFRNVNATITFITTPIVLNDNILDWFRSAPH